MESLDQFFNRTYLWIGTGKRGATTAFVFKEMVGVGSFEKWDEQTLKNYVRILEEEELLKRVMV